MMKMTARVLLGVLGLAIAGAATAADPVMLRKAQKITRNFLVVDTHIDVPYRLTEHWEDVTQATDGGDFDVPRAVSGGLNIPFMSIYTPAEMEAEGGSFELANKLIDMVEDLAKRDPEHLIIVRTTEEAKQAFLARKIGLAMGMENGSPIEHDLSRVKYFRDRGISYITLAHSLTNHLSDSSYDENRPLGGLSEFGREVVREMNRVGIMVDVSHLSDEAFFQVLEVSAVPVIASHSSARRFTPDFERNMSDEMIKALAEKGGIIQINFGSSFLSAEAQAWSKTFWDVRKQLLTDHAVAEDSAEAKTFEADYRAEHPFPYARLDHVLAHIEHVIDLVGVRHVGLGSDFDGVGDSLPEGLKDVSAYPALVEGLLQRGYSEEDIARILGANLMRVWKQAEDYAAAH